MAVGILSIGLMLVATMFPAALYLTTVASERTMAAIVADEAFAKIQLFGLIGSPPLAAVFDYNGFTSMNSIEFSYPPVDPAANNRQYYWSALCKKTSLDSNDTQYLVTVFVSRKTSPAHTYNGGANGGSRPRPIEVSVFVQTDPNELGVSPVNERYINPPATVLDDRTCKIYRVIDRKDPNVVLDRAWEDAPSPPDYIWLIPPPLSGGLNADIEVFQRIIRF